MRRWRALAPALVLAVGCGGDAADPGGHSMGIYAIDVPILPPPPMMPPPPKQYTSAIVLSVAGVTTELDVAGATFPGGKTSLKVEIFARASIPGQSLANGTFVRIAAANGPARFDPPLHLRQTVTVSSSSYATFHRNSPWRQVGTPRPSRTATGLPAQEMDVFETGDWALAVEDTRASDAGNPDAAEAADISAASDTSDGGRARLTLDRTNGDFGPVMLGSTGPAIAFQVVNDSEQDAMAVTSTIGGDGRTQFIVSSKCPEVLEAGKRCTVEVVFRPSTDGAVTASLDLTSANGATTTAGLSGVGVSSSWLSITPPSHQFGSVSVGQQSNEVLFTISNGGKIDSGPVAVSTNAVSFVLSSNGCQRRNLAAADSCIVGVRFAPGIQGNFGATLTASTTPGGSATAVMIATGVASASLRFEDAAGMALPVLDLGNGTVGAMGAPATVFLRNLDVSGTGMLATMLTGASAGDFVIASNTCTGLAAGSACPMQLAFKPSATGLRQATVAVISGAGHAANLVLRGTGTASATPSQLVLTGSGNFGPVAVGMSSAARTFTVSNGPGQPMTGGVTFGTALLLPAFKVTRNGCLLADNTTALPLGPGQSCTFDMRFTPTQLGTQTSALQVSAEPGGAVEVQVSGRGGS